MSGIRPLPMEPGGSVLTSDGEHRAPRCALRESAGTWREALVGCGRSGVGRAAGSEHDGSMPQWQLPRIALISCWITHMKYRS